MGNIASANDKISTDELYKVLQDSNMTEKNVLDMTPSPENFGEIYFRTFPELVTTELPNCMAVHKDVRIKAENANMSTKDYFLLFLKKFGELFPGRFVPLSVRLKIRG